MAARRRGGLQEAVSTFSALLQVSEETLPDEAQRKARTNFPQRVLRSKLALRIPSDPISKSGRHFVIGIASYSPEELRLLDELESMLEKATSETLDVEVFDVLDCHQMSDFEMFIPGIDGVYRTPVIGVISNGKLIDKAAGLADVIATLRRFNVLNHS